jgi:hypothetical protein
MEIDNELGFQYLNTAFTGTNTNALSGNNDPEVANFINSMDMGIASSLSQTELKSYFN